MNEITLMFEPPADPISMNQGDSWSVRGDAKEWRDRAYFAWCEAHPAVGPSGRRFGGPADIHVVLPFPQNRRRDPINFAKTVKHIVDGLVLAGAWEDDTMEFVTQNIPSLSVGTNLPVIVRITERADWPGPSTQPSPPPRSSRARSTTQQQRSRRQRRR